MKFCQNFFLLPTDNTIIRKLNNVCVLKKLNFYVLPNKILMLHERPLAYIFLSIMLAKLSLAAGRISQLNLIQGK